MSASRPRPTAAAYGLILLGLIAGVWFAVRMGVPEGVLRAAAIMLKLGVAVAVLCMSGWAFLRKLESAPSGDQADQDALRKRRGLRRQRERRARMSRARNRQARD